MSTHRLNVLKDLIIFFYSEHSKEERRNKNEVHNVLSKVILP